MRIPVIFAAAAFGLGACAATTDDKPKITAYSKGAPENVAVASVDGEVTDQNADAGDSNRKICKRQVVTGTRFARMRCFTVAEWKEQQRAGREGLEMVQQRALNGDVRPGG
ncbi:MAG: hypothetical protein AAFX08_05940 [Pseudomonadota bacterium]